MSQFLDAARRYRALGLHPIPVAPRGKRPILSSWREFCDRQPTEQEITQWWTATPDANVALVMGRGMFAVDVDGPEGEAALIMADVSLPITAPSATTGKGRHVFFSADYPVKNGVGLVEKVDIRSDGGYVVAPPSIHPTGAQYRWITPLSAGVQPAPAALKALLDRPTSPASAAPKGDDWLTVTLAGAGEGQRDVACTRLAGYFLGKGVPAEAVESLLQIWADRCTPPFPADQVAKCVESIAKKEGEQEIDLAADLLTVEALYSQAPDDHVWIWQDYLAEGSLAMLVAEEKAGKSTLFYALSSAISKGQPFLSRRTTKSPVLILAVEEDATDVKLRARMFGMAPDDPVYFRVGDLPNTERTHQQIKDTVLKHGIKFVILDTLGHYLATVLDSENDNSAVLKAVRPWLRLARETRSCVLLVHHTGKGGQQYRGASAFGGVVDQILTLKYYGGANQRALWARGRYRQTPSDTHLVLCDREYVVLP